MIELIIFYVVMAVASFPFMTILFCNTKTPNPFENIHSAIMASLLWPVCFFLAIHEDAQEKHQDEFKNRR